MFTTIDEFSALGQHTHIEGLGPLMRCFEGLVDDLRCKQYDLLDATITTFDRDFLEFNVHINDLEAALQTFISGCATLLHVRYIYVCWRRVCTWLECFACF